MPFDPTKYGLKPKEKQTFDPNKYGLKAVQSQQESDIDISAAKSVATSVGQTAKTAQQTQSANEFPLVFSNRPSSASGDPRKKSPLSKVVVTPKKVPTKAELAEEQAVKEYDKKQFIKAQKDFNETFGNDYKRGDIRKLEGVLDEEKATVKEIASNLKTEAIDNFVKANAKKIGINQVGDEEYWKNFYAEKLESGEYEIGRSDNNKPTLYQTPTALEKTSNFVSNFMKGASLLVSEPIKAVGEIANYLDRKTFSPDAKIENDPLYQLGKWIEEKVASPMEEKYPQLKNDFWTADVPTGFGQIASMMLTAPKSVVQQGVKLMNNAATKSVFRNVLDETAKQTFSAPSILGTLTMASGEYEQAQQAAVEARKYSKDEYIALKSQSGANLDDLEAEYDYLVSKSPEDIGMELFLKTIPSGAIEMVTVSRLFKRLNESTRGSVAQTINKFGVGGFEGGVEGFVQESLQTAYSNATAQQTYDRTRDILEGVVRSGETGGFVQGLLSAMINALGGKMKAAVTPNQKATIQKAIDEVTETIDNYEENVNALEKQVNSPNVSVQMPTTQQKGVQGVTEIGKPYYEKDGVVITKKEATDLINSNDTENLTIAYDPKLQTKLEQQGGVSKGAEKKTGAKVILPTAMPPNQVVTVGEPKPTTNAQTQEEANKPIIQTNEGGTVVDESVAPKEVSPAKEVVGETVQPTEQEVTTPTVSGEGGGDIKSGLKSTEGSTSEQKSSDIGGMKEVALKKIADLEDIAVKTQSDYYKEKIAEEKEQYSQKKKFNQPDKLEVGDVITDYNNGRGFENRVIRKVTKNSDGSYSVVWQTIGRNATYQTDFNQKTIGTRTIWSMGDTKAYKETLPEIPLNKRKGFIKDPFVEQPKSETPTPTRPTVSGERSRVIAKLKSDGYDIGDGIKIKSEGGNDGATTVTQFSFEKDGKKIGYLRTVDAKRFYKDSNNFPSNYDYYVVDDGIRNAGVEIYDETLRKQGIGTKMYESAQEYLQKQNQNARLISSSQYGQTEASYKLWKKLYREGKAEIIYKEPESGNLKYGEDIGRDYGRGGGEPNGVIYDGNVYALKQKQQPKSQTPTPTQESTTTVGLSEYEKSGSKILKNNGVDGLSDWLANQPLLGGFNQIRGIANKAGIKFPQTEKDFDIEVKKVGGVDVYMKQLKFSDFYNYFIGISDYSPREFYEKKNTQIDTEISKINEWKDNPQKHIDFVSKRTGYKKVTESNKNKIGNRDYSDKIGQYYFSTGASIQFKTANDLVNDFVNKRVSELQKTKKSEDFIKSEESKVSKIKAELKSESTTTVDKGGDKVEPTTETTSSEKIEPTTQSKEDTEQAIEVEEQKELSLQNQTETDESDTVLKRLLPTEEQGRNTSGEINALAATFLSRLHERIESIYGKDSAEKNSIANEEEKYLEDFAKSLDIWVDDADTKFGEFFDKGQEQSVYIDDTKGNVTTVTKLNDGSLSPNWLTFLDRLAIHNTYFPSTAYTLKGFGKTKDGSFVAIVDQPYIKPNPTTEENVVAYMKGRGFELLSKYDDSLIGTVEEKRSFINKDTGVIVEDLHLKNVFEDESGNMFVIDPVISLDTPEKGYGGTRKSTNKITSITSQSKTKEYGKGQKEGRQELLTQEQPKESGDKKPLSLSERARSKAKEVREKGYNEAFGLPHVKPKIGDRIAGFGGKSLDEAIAKAMELFAAALDGTQETIEDIRAALDKGLEPLLDYYKKNTKRFDEEKVRDRFIKNMVEDETIREQLKEKPKEKTKAEKQISDAEHLAIISGNGKLVSEENSDKIYKQLTAETSQDVEQQTVDGYINPADLKTMQQQADEDTKALKESIEKAETQGRDWVDVFLDSTAENFAAVARGGELVMPINMVRFIGVSNNIAAILSQRKQQASNQDEIVSIDAKRKKLHDLINEGSRGTSLALNARRNLRNLFELATTVDVDLKVAATVLPPDMVKKVDNVAKAISEKMTDAELNQATAETDTDTKPKPTPKKAKAKPTKVNKRFRDYLKNVKMPDNLANKINELKAKCK